MIVLSSAAWIGFGLVACMGNTAPHIRPTGSAAVLKLSTPSRTHANVAEWHRVCQEGAGPTDGGRT